MNLNILGLYKSGQKAIRGGSKPVKNFDSASAEIIGAVVLLIFAMFLLQRICLIIRSTSVRFIRSIFKSKTTKHRFQPTRHLDARGYVFLSQANETEHRHIAKQLLGRDLYKSEIVHHINGSKTDNRVWNLCVMDREKHELFHSWLRWKKEKDGRYPSFKDQKRILYKEYNGILLEKFDPKRAS